jgi:amidase
VAAGLAPVAHGSDGGGSIRIPASVCGLVGLKPSRGRISLGPVKADVTGLPTDGALGRTVADCAALLDAMAVRVPGDPHNATPLAAGDTFLAASARPPAALRIARFAEPVITSAPIDPECLQAFDDAAQLLTELGHHVEDVAPPLGPDAVPAFEVVWSVGATMTPVAPEDEEQLLPLTRWLRERGARTSATQFALALAAMQGHARRALVALAPYDAVLTPTLAQLPAPVGALRDDGDPAADFEAQKAFTPFTAVWNVTGMPAVSLPLHWSAGGLPVGVMVAARPGEEALLLALAAQLEAARPWRDRHPPLW